MSNKSLNIPYRNIKNHTKTSLFERALNKTNISLQILHKKIKLYTLILLYLNFGSKNSTLIPHKGEIRILLENHITIT